MRKRGGLSNPPSIITRHTAVGVFASVIFALMSVDGMEFRFDRAFVGGVEFRFALSFVGCVKLRFNFGAAMFRLVERQAQRTERGGENRNAENNQREGSRFGQNGWCRRSPFAFAARRI